MIATGRSLLQGDGTHFHGKKSRKARFVIASEAKQSDSLASRPEVAEGESKDLFWLPEDPSLGSGQCAALDCHGASRLAMTVWDFLRAHQS